MAKIIILLIVLFIPVFVLALLCLISLILSSGGWRKLARQYPAKAMPHGNRFDRLVAMVGDSSYRGAMKAVVTGEGVFLDVSPVFRLGHPPLFIPFGAIRNVRRTVRFKADYVDFDAGDPAVVISLPSVMLKDTPVALR